MDSIWKSEGEAIITAYRKMDELYQEDKLENILIKLEEISPVLNKFIDKSSTLTHPTEEEANLINEIIIKHFELENKVRTLKTDVVKEIKKIKKIHHAVHEYNNNRN